MISIRAYGDSMARGIGDVGTGNDVPGWPGRLAHSVQAHAQHNVAIAGARVVDVLNGQLTTEADPTVDVALLSVGGNDAIDQAFRVEQFERHFSALVDALLSQHRVVIALSVADHSRAWPLPRPIRRALHRRIALVNAVIRSQRQRGLLLMEPWRRGGLDETEMRHPDRVHLSPLGYQRLAELTAASLALPVVAEPLPLAGPRAGCAWRPAVPGAQDLRRALRRIPALIHCASEVWEPSRGGGRPYPAPDSPVSRSHLPLADRS